MRSGQFEIGRPDGYKFTTDRNGWIKALPGPDGTVPVIGGKLNLQATVKAPQEWSSEDDATGNNVQISDGVDLYSSASFEQDLMSGQVQDVLWALSTAGNPSSGRLLELGCGPGFLLEALGERLPGWSMLGVDPSPVSCAQARERGVDVRNGTLETVEIDGQFDAVVVMGNFQLHYDPAATLAALARLTRPGGVLYLDSKNPRSSTRAVARLLMQTPMLRELKATNAFAAHAFHGMRHGIPKSELSRLLDEAGWQVEGIRTTSPRLLRFKNKHDFGTGIRARVWGAFDAWDSRIDERAWLQVAAKRAQQGSPAL